MTLRLRSPKQNLAQFHGGILAALFSGNFPRFVQSTMTAISSLQNFVTDALECTQFRLIRDDADFEDESVAFHPEMAHQIFGEQESIFGYRDLQIDVCFAASSLDIYFNIKYSKKVSGYI